MLGHTPHDGFVYIDSLTCAYVITAGHMTTVKNLILCWSPHNTHQQLVSAISLNSPPPPLTNPKPATEYKTSLSPTLCTVLIWG